MGSSKPLSGATGSSKGNINLIEQEGEYGLNDFEMGTSVGTSVQSVRLGFIRKVYGILTAQLALTVLMGAFFMLIPPVRHFVVASPWLIILSCIGTFGFLIALFCLKDRHPINLQLLFGFTFCEAICVGAVCALYAEAGLGFIVFEALLITAIIFGSLTAYCFYSKKDFSFLHGFLFAGLMALIFAGFFTLILQLCGVRVSPWLSFGISCFGALLFSGYILFDTSMIIKHYSADQYIEASIALYLDLINLFLQLLQILAALQDRN